MSEIATRGLQWPDWLVVAVYMGSMLWLGWYCARRQTDASEYFIAAKRHIHPVLVGISLAATLLSTISYLGKPGEMVGKGPVFLLAQIAAVPVAYVIVAYWLIPRLMTQRVTSAYELLEQRLGLGARLLGAVLFVGLRLIWMGLMIYLAAVALAIVMGLGLSWTPTIAAVMAGVTVVYTAMGGLRAVVMTDVVQFSLLVLGAIVPIVMISVDAGGLSWWPQKWSENWDHQPWFSFDPRVRITFFGAFVSMTVWHVATAGGDQLAIQRYMATRDALAARRSYLATAIASVGTTVLLSIVGLALLSFFTRHPEALGVGMELKKSGDHIFPYYIAHFLPVGISGLVISAALAAAMSSVDSGVNSIAAVVMTDFLRRFGREPKTERGAVLFSKWISVAIGVVVLLASLLVKHAPGNFAEMTMKTGNLLIAPVFVLFVLALWVPFATPLGALVGCAYGVATAVLIAFWELITDGPPLSFNWVGPSALVVDLVVAILLSRWGPRRENRRGTLVVGSISLAALACMLIVLAT